MWKIDKGRATGTTTAAYVTAFAWECAELREKTIHLVNTHATLSMYFKVLARYSQAQTSAKEDTLVAETSLAAGEDARLQFNKQYFQIIVQVVNNSGAATYELNYCGQGA
uniref:Uncharacterized protein n=1 Tax=viral metagenome TaxID=1070528 RepID=A0A6M3KUZ3_9ZZZZ